MGAVASHSPIGDDDRFAAFVIEVENTADRSLACAREAIEPTALHDMADGLVQRDELASLCKFVR